MFLRDILDTEIYHRLMDELEKRQTMSGNVAAKLFGTDEITLFNRLKTMDRLDPRIKPMMEKIVFSVSCL